jgi:hypothetical protein
VSSLSLSVPTRASTPSEITSSAFALKIDAISVLDVWSPDRRGTPTSRRGDGRLVRGLRPFGH